VQLFSVLARAIRDSARNDSFIELAAVLFAVARLIAGRFADASLEDQDQEPNAFPSLQSGLKILTVMPLDADRATIYRYSIQGLQAIEAALETPRDRHLLRQPVFLPTIEHQGDVLLSGMVRFWLRPPSELSELRQERRKASRTRKAPPGDDDENRKSLPMELRWHPERQLNTLGAYWQANPELPPCRPRNPIHREHFLVTDSGKLAREESFRVALCPLAGEFHPHFEIREDGARFCVHRSRPMADPASLKKHLDLLLEAACRQRVDLMLLPELTVDGASRDYVAERLDERAAEHPQAMVPGSFHFWSAGEPRPVNEARLFDSLGAELLTHRKAGRFRITPRHVRDAPHFFRHCAHVRNDGALCDDIFEDIDRTASLEFLDTSLGRLAVAICADGIDHEQNTLHDAIRAIQPDLVLIASMSVKTGPFEQLAADLAQLGIGTLMVNAACVNIDKPPPMLAIADLALPDMPDMLPTRIRWRAGDADVELYDRTSKRWVSAEPGGGSATDWLGDGDQRLGLILDLGPHFRLPLPAEPQGY